MSRTHAHQGVIALAAVREYVSVESILQAARDKGEAPLLVVCDEISDPHNLGAIIRYRWWEPLRISSRIWPPAGCTSLPPCRFTRLKQLSVSASGASGSVRPAGG